MNRVHFTFCGCATSGLPADHPENGPFLSAVPSTDPAIFKATFGDKANGGFCPCMLNAGPVVLDDGSVALPYVCETFPASDGGPDILEDTTWAGHTQLHHFNPVNQCSFMYIVFPCATEAERKHLLLGVYHAVMEAPELQDNHFQLTAVWKRCLMALLSGNTLADGFIAAEKVVPGGHSFRQCRLVIRRPVPVHVIDVDEPLAEPNKRERDESEADEPLDQSETKSSKVEPEPVAEPIVPFFVEPAPVEPVEPEQVIEAVAETNKRERDEPEADEPFDQSESKSAKAEPVAVAVVEPMAVPAEPEAEPETNKRERDEPEATEPLDQSETKFAKPEATAELDAAFAAYEAAPVEPSTPEHNANANVLSAVHSMFDIADFDGLDLDIDVFGPVLVAD